MAEKGLFTTNPAFMAEDLFLLAIAHEYEESSRYELLSLRFLTYSIGISSLLSEHAKESMSRLQALLNAAERLHTNSIVPASSCRWEVENMELTHGFFIANDAMASEALNQALSDEYNTWDFYCQLRHGNSTVELDALLKGFVDQILLQCRVIEENIEQQTFTLPKSLTSVKPINQAFIKGRYQ